MNRLDAMQAFVRVAELASFTRAADSLGLPKASVSTAVQQLESSLGARLLHRTTRRVELTQDGRTFYERSKDLLADMDELQSLFHQGPQALRGRLRVDLPNAIARNILIPQLPTFLDVHPQLEIELSTTDRRVDLVREGFDCVLRVGSLGDANLIARHLGNLPMVNVASPEYLRRFGTPKTLDDLARHRLIHYSTVLGSRSAGWEYVDGEGEHDVPMAGIVTVNSTDAYEAAALAGLGMIQAPMLGMRRHLEQGAMVEVLPAHRAGAMPVSLLYANRRNLSKRVKAFMDWVDETVGAYLEGKKT
jgi:DNA-binding transcriptional LysR family regulator